MKFSGDYINLIILHYGKLIIARTIFDKSLKKKGD